MKLGRKFIGADINLGAIETTVIRLNVARSDIDIADKQIDILGVNGSDKMCQMAA